MFFNKKEQIFDIIINGDNMKKEKFLPLIGISVFILYFIFNEYGTLPIKLLVLDYSSLPLGFKIIYLLSVDFILISIIYFIYLKRFIKDFKDFKDNFKNYTKKYIEYWALAFGLMILSNVLILIYFPNSSATNQQAVEQIFTVAPVYMIIAACIFAPIIEESVFRLSIRNIFKNDKVFIIVSGLVFGSMHVIGSFTNLVDLIYVIPYSIPGFVFAYTLVKSKNIFVPMELHLFHNTFMMIIEVIINYIL